MPRAAILSLLLLSAQAAAASAVPAVVRSLMPDAGLVGAGRYEFLWFDAYQATLFAPDGRWERGRPCALELHYFRRIEGKAIAERTMDELRGQGFRDELRLAAWYAQLLQIFPDVEDGTRLTGYLAPSGETRFFNGDVPIGQVQDPLFGPLFMDIWLGPGSSAQKLRKQLLGLP